MKGCLGGLKPRRDGYRQPLARAERHGRQAGSGRSGAAAVHLAIESGWIPRRAISSGSGAEIFEARGN